MTSPIMTVRGLTITSGAHAIVDDVSLDLRQGEILGLVGESGSGKTTFGLALLGHARRGLAIRAGAIRFGELDILALDERARRQARQHLVSYVPQDPGTALNPSLRVGTLLAEACPAKLATPKSDLLALLADVRLPADEKFLKAYCHQLSGGQQQRVAIAMAFARRPKVIMLDEPTTGLDVTTQAHILETIRRLCAEHGVAAVYVSHDLAVVANLAHRVAVLYSGKVVELGETRTVLAQPLHPYTAALIQAVPDLGDAAKVTFIPGQAPEPRNRPPGCAFAPRCGISQAACEAAPVDLRTLPDGHQVRCLFPEHTRAEREAAPIRPRPASTLAPVLELQNLAAFHGRKQVLHDISLQLPEQLCLAVVGESGSGKTTLARSIAGLHRQFTGDLLFRSEALARSARRRDAAQRRHIQYVFQNPYASLNPRRSIGASLLMALGCFERLSRKEAEARVRQALEEVALPASAAAKMPRELSGGQRQRAAIARALIVEPQLLVCDEVTSALDVSVQAIVMDLLARLRAERGLSMLFVTHNLALAGNFAEKLAVMQSGRIVEFGDTAEILANPQAAETQRLLQDAPRFRAAPAADIIAVSARAG